MKDDVWRLDEVVVRITGQKCWLWRAVDQEGYVLDEIVQTRRNTKAARRLLTRLLKKQGLPPTPRFSGTWCRWVRIWAVKRLVCDGT